MNYKQEGKFVNKNSQRIQNKDLACVKAELHLQENQTYSVTHKHCLAPKEA